MRYEWSKLNNLQKGAFGEHFAKMEFAMFGLLVFTAEVDDRGIDFVSRNDHGNHFDVQVKTITGNNYTYITKSKFRDTLWVCLVVLRESNPPESFLFSGGDWKTDTEGLLSYHHYPNAKEPEFGINVTNSRAKVLEKFRLTSVIEKLREPTEI